MVAIALGEHVLPGPAAERFALAKQLQADGVELHFGPYDWEHHLLWQPEGPRTLHAQAQAAGIALPSVYAGYFHQCPLSAADPAARRRHSQVLERLLDSCAEAGIATLVLPLLGEGEIHQEAAFRTLAEALTVALPRAMACHLTLALETILPVVEVQKLLAPVRGPAVRVAYDVGNAALLGYDAVADCQLLGEMLGQIRAKDCSAGGQRVPWGQGIVAWAELVAALTQQRYSGWWVLETAPGEEAVARARADVEGLRRLLSP